MYTFKEIDNILEYDNFYKSFSKAPIMQDYAWSKVKTNFGHVICGLYQDNVLVGACLILIKKLAYNLNLFYVPRGYLIDFSNKELLKIFTDKIKEYAKKRHAYCIKIDPYISLTEKRVNERDGEVYNFYSENNELITNNLKELGYIHRGFKKEIPAYLQPRFTMAVPLIKPDKTFMSEDELLHTMKKNVRGYLGDYHAKRGVFFEHTNNEAKLDDFMAIINKTEARQNISLRNRNYFHKMMTSFGDRALLFFAKIDVDKYIAFLDESFKDPKADIEFLNKQKESALALKAERGSIITVSASIVILPANTEGIRMAEFLYAGNDTSVLPNLKINNGLTYYRLLYCLENGYQYANLGGVDGSLNDHLSTFKSKFNPLVLEFIGEYDLPVNKTLYKMISTLEPSLKNTYRFVVKHFKRG